MTWNQIIKEEVEGWKLWEIVWLLVSCGIITVLSIYWHDSVVGIISAVSGVACVVCTGKGKLVSYLFGTINVLLYAYISFQARFYGEVMINILYYFPMNFYGFYVWRKHINADTHEVDKRLMKKAEIIKTSGLIILGSLAYGLLLELLGGSLPFIDAFSTVASVVAMIVTVKMYAEQWVIWIIVNIVSVVMWALAFVNGNDSISTLMMWSVYLINSVIMYIKWNREARQNAV